MRLFLISSYCQDGTTIDNVFACGVSMDDQMQSGHTIKEEGMANRFGATSTADDVLSGVNLRGKRILVTGVSAGLGVETARSLAAHGAHVVGAARDLTKAKAATTQLQKNGGTFELVELDLADLKSVRACAD